MPRPEPTPPEAAVLRGMAGAPCSPDWALHQIPASDSIKATWCVDALARRRPRVSKCDGADRWSRAIARAPTGTVRTAMTHPLSRERGDHFDATLDPEGLLDCHVALVTRAGLRGCSCLPENFDHKEL
ncbi:MAG: hypothetical protein M0Z95_19230 [Actinomycetota bacterium]|jgi:hypothetical protein|nr:hypothetical protein [Actinomycetota bacterium]